MAEMIMSEDSTEIKGCNLYLVMILNLIKKKTGWIRVKSEVSVLCNF